jgi:hypothetical protein
MHLIAPASEKTGQRARNLPSDERGYEFGRSSWTLMTGGQVTQWLARWRAGDHEALERRASWLALTLLRWSGT